MNRTGFLGYNSVSGLSPLRISSLSGTASFSILTAVENCGSFRALSKTATSTAGSMICSGTAIRPIRSSPWPWPITRFAPAANPATTASSSDGGRPGGRHRVAALVHDSKLTVNDPNPEASHRPILYDSGRPSSVIWFRTLHATTDSATRPPRDRARRRSPRIDLYRKNAFSTRA